MILLDLHLPDINGLDVIRALQANPDTASIPVAVLSADATSTQVGRLLAAGARSTSPNPSTSPRSSPFSTPMPDDRTAPEPAGRSREGDAPWIAVTDSRTPVTCY